MSHGTIGWTVRSTLVAASAALIVVLGTAPAFAHGFSSVLYVEATSAEKGDVRTHLALEYDLLVVSAADAERDDALFRAGTAAFEGGDPAEQAAALAAHAGSVLKYVSERFTIGSGSVACAAKQVGDFTLPERDGVPYALLVLDHSCPSAAGRPQLSSTLFPDSEGFVRGTKTIVTYQVDGLSSSAALDAGHPSFELGQSGTQRFWEFFRLGAEHLLGGLDHILFLLALIAGSRRLREIVLVATSFTLAHSVSFILAALGLVDVPGRVVEPIIALSIAVVAGWYLWRIWRRGEHATDLDTTGHFSLDRAGWLRLAVVFCFGLVHGLGFAGALGIDGAWSWTLLWSLLVFNVGIESVQLGIILAVFPVLTLLRHRAPRLELWTTCAIATGVAAIGLFWFVQRLFGW